MQKLAVSSPDGDCPAQRAHPRGTVRRVDAMPQWLRIGAMALLAGTATITAAELLVERQVKPDQKWVAEPTRTLEQLPAFQPARTPVTKYGGRSDRQLAASGYFRVQKVEGRWWLVDPEGGLMLQAGVTSVAPVSKHGSKEAFERLYGTPERWADAATRFLHEAGFNGLGAFSNTELPRHSAQPLPYTITLSMAGRFGKQLGITRQQPGHIGFAGDCLPALHPGFAAFCDQTAETLATTRDDPWLVGVFSDNELPGSLRMLDNMLELDASQPALAPQRAAAWEWLRARRGQEASASGLTDADRSAFLGHVFDTYLRVTTQAIRKHSPNHLCLGPRFHSPLREARPVWEAAGRHLDAVAMNYYGTWTPRASDLANWHQWSGKPCLITEFYAKGADSGYANQSGAGWIVHTQADRGRFYQNFTLALIESKTCVGWHWLRYIDNDPADTSTDPSNRDSNKGLVNIRYEPYVPLVDQMRSINTNLYRLADYFDGRK